ncbi:cysteine/serine-rich nuclear protein 1-like [Osmerus eperlanus]|uniref:cysteine/serine-rich nuclear protein 1-like n=1 Tax=Osmerus eperlanus TaxID=29151 RepID=UPI002E151F43
MSGVLKRKFAEVDEEDPCYASSSSFSSPSSSASLEWESDGMSLSSDDQDFTPSIPASPTTSLPIRSILKKAKATHRHGRVSFDLVTVFLFQRSQGFTSVPSRGGATLGMVRRHSSLCRYTLAEHALDRQHRCRERLRERLRQEKLKELRQKMTTNGAILLEEANRPYIDQLPDEDLNIHLSDADLDEGGFLHPYPSKQRQSLLRAAGVKRIDREEKRQLHALRLSREECGCNCQGFCEPETCACSLAGIKCQMDHSSFPCGCTRDCCGNTNGRVEFNSRRVQTHYLHTVMRLELERRLQDDETPNCLDQKRVSLKHQENPKEEDQDEPQQYVQEKSCPFGLTTEDDGLHLTIPTTPMFHFSVELAVSGENSCSSDMSCSSANSEDSESGGTPLVNQPLLEEGDEGLVRMLKLCDSETEDCSMGTDSEARHIKQSYQCFNNSGKYAVTNAANSHTDKSIGSCQAEYLDENANQDATRFANSPIQEYPNTPSPSIDYSSNSYMDLSLSSESDLEFFDNFPDYSSGPLHKSFKGHTYPDNFHYLQLLSPPHHPQYDETSTYLLESLIGLSEPTPEPNSSFTDSQQFEVIQ